MLTEQVYQQIADAVYKATINTAEAKQSLRSRERGHPPHHKSVNMHPAYLAVREHLLPLVMVVDRHTSLLPGLAPVPKNEERPFEWLYGREHV